MPKYDIEKIRNKLRDKQGGKFKDPNEFRPPQAKEGETIKYRFYILPPLAQGDKCADGVASKSMELFYLSNGAHWINNRSHACPRVHDEIECPVCQLGFDMMSETDDKRRRSEIAKQFLPRTQYAVNIYFPKDKINPADHGGRVMWMNISKQVFDKCEACLMTDDAGDPTDPQPFGVFFDESDAYLFQLEITKKNQWNDYSSSKFLANVGKRPLSQKPERIAEILSMRHDLFTKFQDRDVDGLAQLKKTLLSGSDDDDAGFDDDEVEAPKLKTEAKVEKATKVVKETLIDDSDEVEEEVASPRVAAPSVVAEDEDELQGLLEGLEADTDE